MFVESGSGEGSAIADEAYVAQGATILPDADAVFGEATMIVKVNEPQPAEVERLRPHHILFTYLHLAADEALTRGLMELFSRAGLHPRWLLGRIWLPVLIAVSVGGSAITGYKVTPFIGGSAQTPVQVAPDKTSATVSGAVTQLRCEPRAKALYANARTHGHTKKEAPDPQATPLRVVHRRMIRDLAELPTARLAA